MVSLCAIHMAFRFATTSTASALGPFAQSPTNSTANGNPALQCARQLPGYYKNEHYDRYCVVSQEKTKFLGRNCTMHPFPEKSSSPIETLASVSTVPATTLDRNVKNVWYSYVYHNGL